MKSQSGDIKLSCRSNAHSVRAILGRVMSVLADWGIKDEDATSVEMVLAETLNNIAEHAFPKTNNAFITLHLKGQGEQLGVTVRDCGDPMPDLSLPEGALPENYVLRDDLPEGGFGWFLIRSVAHDLQYRRQGNENCLCYKIRLSGSIEGNANRCCGIANDA